MKSYIESKVKSGKEKANTLHGKDIVMVVDPLPENISLDRVLRKVEAYIPSAMTVELDAVYIGDFEILKQRSLQALYFEGTIYLTNEQEDEHDMFDDLIHEISHVVETLAKDFIYSDGTIRNEFLEKRQKLFDILEINGYSVSWKRMLNHKFDQELDNFFYWEVGYDKLRTLIDGLFISPYSATSLREYWGKGFEKYVLKERSYLSKVSPKLYDKIETLFTRTYNGEQI